MPSLITFGWALGLFTVGLVLRYGRQVDVLAWSIAILVQPLVCAVYPLNILHPAAQVVAGLLPPTHIFEATRAAVAGEPNLTELLIGFVGGLIALGLSLAFYFASIRSRPRARPPRQRRRVGYAGGRPIKPEREPGFTAT